MTTALATIHPHLVHLTKLLPPQELDNHRAKIGTSLTVRKPNRFTVTNGAGLALQDITEPSTNITISNRLGLHARASAKFTKLAGSFPCEVWIARGDRRVNAKSIMGVMMLAAGIGTEVIVDTEGEREQEAMDALLALIADRFGEAE